VSRTVVLSATVVLALVAACMAALVVAVVKPAEATFPGRNGKIAFAGIRHSEVSTTNNWEIYTTRPGTFKLVNITNSPSNDTNPDWSPNGRKIAYSGDADGSVDIYVMRANGAGKKRLTDSSGTDSFPVWSPDGTKIAFHSNRAGCCDIFIMDADGGNVRRLTNNSNINTRPSWSPDGTKIAFQSNPPLNEDVRDIHTINVDGSDEKNLTNSTAYEGGPDWSPDGQRIVFEGTFQTSNALYNAIKVMNADGTDAKYLRNGYGPSWSPNGERIAFEPDAPNEIAAMNPDGSGLTFLTETPDLSVLGPDWQPRP
jgi:Tol biopolymer transport system component